MTPEMERAAKAIDLFDAICNVHDASVSAYDRRIRAMGRVLAAFSQPVSGAFKIGDRVTKARGSSWTGKVVGFYSTDLTPSGCCVESENEPGSVQIYPGSALRLVAAVDGRCENDR